MDIYSVFNVSTVIYTSTFSVYSGKIYSGTETSTFSVYLGTFFWGT